MTFKCTLAGVDVSRTDAADYLADNYGACSIEPCQCLRDGWKGRACPNWIPTTARDLDELKAVMEKSMNASAEMPRYKSHKEVHALKIKEVVMAPTSLSKDREIRTQLTFADDGYAPLDVEPSLFARYTPVPGDYYVVYEGGYVSISPAKAFEEGYTRIT